MKNRFLSICNKQFSSNANLKDILPDHLTYKIPNYTKNKTLDFPWLISGAPILDIKSRLLPDQLFTRNSITRRTLLNHLFKIYRGVLLASTQNDTEFLNEYLENNFYLRLAKKLENLTKEGATIELFEDMKADKNKRLSPELHLYDSVIIKGLSTNRESNGKEEDYSTCNDIEDMGFISYIHKSMADPGNFLTKNNGEAMLNNSNFKKIIFRAHCMFKCGLKLFITDKNNDSLINYNSNYNYNHAVIFECEMQELSPLKSFGEAETYTEWISKHDFGVWKMIDIDNWMKGNNYFLISK